MANNNHVAYLDSIRGLAAMAVITEHYIIAYGLPCRDALCKRVLDMPPFNFWWDGGAAVSMFFVLSGMVLSLKYFRLGCHPDPQHFNLVNYTLNRLFRLWPPYLVVLGLSAALYLAATDVPFTDNALPPSSWLTDTWRANPLSAKDMLREAVLLKLPENVVLLPQAWTLTIELALSLLLPVGLLLVERGAVWLVFFACLVVSLLGVSAFLLHFLLGLLIARNYRAIAGYFKTRVLRRRLLLLIGFALYTSGGLNQNSQIPESILWAISGLGAGVLLTFAVASTRLQALLSLPLLRQIGRVSYSAYLIHMLVLLCVTPRILHGMQAVTGNRSLLWLEGYGLSVAVVLLLSWACYYLLEVPSIALGRRTIGLFS
ncbi:acyltransferase family protein [Methylomonas koyamae]|uniref:acyltransferase family protein n=1 Tax=Methylomonas koyamae TaxID=702114 RepID=UPI000BC3446E|nr:acyltransferase [Methylomonas koyamae]ATG91022.1 acyltransferase [Methylomonas koyamae]